MPEIAVTGGIGVGKSTVASSLASRGAVLIDADVIVRDLQEPGQSVFNAMVDRWGDAILAEDGTLDRAATAAIVFHDRAELSHLNSIVHPAVATEVMHRRLSVRSERPDAVVVLDIPLLAEAIEKQARGQRQPVYLDLHGIVAVDADSRAVLRRLLDARDLAESDIRARMVAQATREDRLAVADLVIDNSGSRADLEARVDECWAWAKKLGSRSAERRSIGRIRLRLQRPAAANRSP